MVTPFSSTFFSHDGTEIAYDTYGDGSPIVLVHGFASTAEVNWYATGWHTFLASLGFRVIAFDHRGHGRSAKLYTSSAYRLDFMAQDLFALLSHLAIDQCDVMGYSMGARVAATFAAAYPHCVRRLIFGGLSGAMLSGLASAQTQEIIVALRAPSLEDVVGEQGRSFRRFAEQTKSDLEALAFCLESSRQKITAEQLSRIVCPTLVVVGEKDEIAGSQALFLEAMPHAQSVILPGLDHMKTVGNQGYKHAVAAFLETSQK